METVNVNVSTINTLSLLVNERLEVTRRILENKRKKNLTFEQIAQAVGRNVVFVTSVILGENSIEKEHAEKLLTVLDIKDDRERLVNVLVRHAPIKGQIPRDVLLQDPLIYRLHEINLVYGLALKEIIQEKFGDGVMSAIDFMVNVEKEQDPKGDRVKIVLSGKFLPYRKF